MAKKARTADKVDDELVRELMAVEGAAEATAAAVCGSNPADKVASGRITQLYPNRGGCYIKLLNPTPRRPKDDLFQIKLDHPNYNALYSLALSSAVNGYALTIRTDEPIVSSKIATVCYLKQDF